MACRRTYYSLTRSQPASETPRSKQPWIYDLRTNKHCMLKTNPLKPKDLDEFVACYVGANPADAVSDAHLGPAVGLKPDLQGPLKP